MNTILNGKGVVPLLILIAVCVAMVVFLWFWSRSAQLSRGDFTGYWSASYLFRIGSNPYDEKLMLQTQRDVIGSDLDFVVMAWNPPVLFVFLVPLTYMTFINASATWFVINLLLILLACILLARMYFPDDLKHLILYFVTAMLFSPVLSALAIGQITSLVLFGLTAFLYFSQKRYWFAAGLVLLLISVKPHMAILPGLYILLFFLKRRISHGLIGLLVGGLICVVGLFLFRVEWIADLSKLLSIAPLGWATPTFGGILSKWQITDLGRFGLVLFIPLVIFLALKKTPEPKVILPTLILLNVPFTVFGWSYDQIVLLIPLAQIFGWLKTIKHAAVKISFGIVLSSTLLLNLYQRVLLIEDVYFVWVPMVWIGLYAFVWVIFSRAENRVSDSLDKSDNTSFVQI